MGKWLKSFFSFFASIGRDGRDQFIKTWFSTAKQLVERLAKDYAKEHEGELVGNVLALENKVWELLYEKVGKQNGTFVKLAVLYALDDYKNDILQRYKKWRDSQ